MSLSPEWIELKTLKPDQSFLWKLGCINEEIEGYLKNKGISEHKIIFMMNCLRLNYTEFRRNFLVGCEAIGLFPPEIKLINLYQTKMLLNEELKSLSMRQQSV
jgi:hypothetical protein